VSGFQDKARALACSPDTSPASFKWSKCDTSSTDDTRWRILLKKRATGQEFAGPIP